MKYFGIAFSTLGVFCSLLSLYLVSSRKPEVKAEGEQILVVTEEERERNELKQKWDRIITSEMTYVKDPRDGSCWRRTFYSKDPTYSSVSCFGVQSLLVNP